jgi:hypothetical protein
MVADYERDPKQEQRDAVSCVYSLALAFTGPFPFKGKTSNLPLTS